MGLFTNLWCSSELMWVNSNILNICSFIFEFKYPVDQEWKLAVSKNLDVITRTYEKITNKFRDIDNYILKDAKSKEEFIEKIKKQVEDLPETSQQIFLSFLQSIE